VPVDALLSSPALMSSGNLRVPTVTARDYWV
jgi:hypothetical protein